MDNALLCETVTGQSMAELIAAREAAVLADMVEVRLDGVRDLDVAAALSGLTRPVIATCRPTWEGGRFGGSEEERRAIVTRALECGADFVDVEWRAGFDDVVRRAPKRVVVSTHDFSGIPSDLEDRVRAMRATGAAIIKIAVTVARLTDTLRLLPIARDGDAVVIGMGAAGVPTRMLASVYGSRWTYAGNGVAPGQIPARVMIDQLRFRVVNRRTRLFGVVSTKALHSLSPVMHNAAFAAAGLDAVYVPLPTEDFDDFIAYAEAIGIEGASITIPFKREAARVAAGGDARARAVGAANTLRRANGTWEATNTDVEGFLAPLDETFGKSLVNVRVSVLGAGGSARAVVVGLLSRGARVTVHARRAEQARELGAEFPIQIGPWPPAPASWDLLVNCTPLGGADLRAQSPLPDGMLDGEYVYDLTYGPGDSRLIAQAQAAGCRTLDGLAMLVAQAERQFEWWTGQRPVSGVMGGVAAESVRGAQIVALNAANGR